MKIKTLFLALAAASLFSTASFAGILSSKSDDTTTSTPAPSVSDTNDNDNWFDTPILPRKASSTPDAPRVGGGILNPKPTATPDTPRRGGGILNRKAN